MRRDVLRGEVQGEHPVPQLAVGLDEIAHREATDGAHQDVQATVSLEQTGDETLHGGIVADVAALEEQAPPCLRVEDRFETLTLTVHDPRDADDVTLAQEALGDGLPEGAASTRDDDDTLLDGHGRRYTALLSHLRAKASSGSLVGRLQWGRPTAREVRLMFKALMLALLLVVPGVATAAELPIFDAHVHYSHDAWSVVPPKEAVAILRKAGLKRALVSSSDDEGTQMLLKEAPDLIIPELRPYRRRGELSSWVRDPENLKYVEDLLKKHKYVAIGEFHLFGADADLPIPRRIIELAKEHGLVLHAHSDADAIDRIFQQDPGARVLWAHSGFESPAKVREMLRKHKTLWADLAFRSEQGSGGKVPPEWREVFVEFSDRFMVGTDTFVPERWHYVPDHATFSRAWLGDLPRDVAERIAWKNGEALFGGR